MSVSQSAFSSSADDDTVKKRRLINDSSINDSNTPSSSPTVKSPLKKRFKRNSLEQGLSHKTLQRIKSDSINVSQQTSRSSTQDFKSRTPCYKKNIFPDSPIKTDPYDLPETPQRPRKLVRAKARTNLLESCPIAASESSSIPGGVKERSRRPPSSPHPGKDIVLSKKQEEEDVVPSVSFNSLTSRSTLVTPSSASRTNMAQNNDMKNLKTPTSRRILKHGISTSSLKTRLPVVVDWDGQYKSDMESFSLSKLNSPLRTTRSSASASLISQSNEKTPILRRQRSSSFERLPNICLESPCRNLRLTPERLRALSLENNTLVYHSGSSPLKKKLSTSTFRDTGIKKDEKLPVSQQKNSESDFAPSTSDKYVVQPSETDSKSTECRTQISEEPILTEESLDMIDGNGMQTPEVVIDSQGDIPDADLKSILRVAHAGSKSEKRIKFGSLDVYYFGRDQGFEVVPKQGEVALGMRYSHFQARQFKILKTRRQKINFDDSEDSELSEDEEIGIAENHFYEKPLNERIKILEAAGVVIEKQKKNNLIRQARDQCGCSCRGGVCKPATCECFRSGIKCQVDGPKENGSTYPCSCYNAQLCSNEYGRDAYDFDRVTKSRRAAIQRWRDSEKTGIHAPSRLIKFYDNEEVVADSQELCPPPSNIIQGHSTLPCSPNPTIRSHTNNVNANVVVSANSLFPPSQSLL